LAETLWRSYLALTEDALTNALTDIRRRSGLREERDFPKAVDLA
jgi:hypothetical protein